MKSERQKIIAKLDALCRKILLIRDSRDGETFKCISCGKILPLDQSNVSHYCGRRHLITRWDLSNISLSCVYCNKWLSGNLIEYRKALIEKCGIKEVERLESIYQQPAGYSVFDLQIMYEEYKKVYESLKRAKDLELV